MKLISRSALVLAFAISGGLMFAGCRDSYVTLDTSAGAADGVAGQNGAVKLSLSAGGVEVGNVTATVTSADGTTQTHEIDVSGENGVISIFLGNLPDGENYTVRLVAGECSGSTSFSIRDGQTTLVDVGLSCPGNDADAGPRGSGSVQITGHLPADAGSPPLGACDHIAGITATPALLSGDEASSVEVVLRSGVVASAISWSSASTNGGVGAISEQSGDADAQVAFKCSASGTVYVIANVTAESASGSCTEHARTAVECLVPSVPPAPRCGDGVLNPVSEECDGTALPANAAAGSSCSIECKLIAPPEPARCGDGLINQPAEVCDGSALPADAPAGSLCTPDCKLVPPQPELGACGQCARDNCQSQRDVVNANLGSVKPIVDCVLGTSWQSGASAPASSCASGDLLTCYCGTLSGQDCSNAAPASLNGECVAQVLTGTGCANSACVAPIFLNPANATGKAMQYIQCQQDFCYDVCFSG